MNSYRPYLIRALYEWISDNGLTPHLLVDAEVEGVSVPMSAINEGRVVLNIADRAVAGLNIDDQYVSFSARFSGVSHEIWVPIGAVLAIYARENGQGMVIPDDPYHGLDSAEALDEDLTAAEAAIEDAVRESQPKARTPLSAVPSQDGNSPPEGPEDTDPQPPRKGNHLRVVK